MQTFKNLANLATTLPRVAFFVATPFKSLAVYRHYFSIAEQINQKDRKRSLVVQFRALFTLLVYFILQNTFFLFFQNSQTQLTLHILTYDTLNFFGLSGSFYLLYTMECCLAIYYLRVVYFRPSMLINNQLKATLFGSRGSESIQSRAGGKPLKTLSSSPAINATIRRTSVLIANSIESFILAADIGLLAGFVQYISVFFKHFSQLETFCKIAYFLCFLTHSLIYHVFAYALIYVLILMCTQGFMCIVYMHRYVRRNTGQIRKSIYQKNASFLLCRLLRENIVIFQLLFSGSATFGNVFLAFQLFNLPANALFTILIMFGKRMEHFTLYVVVAFASHELLGTVLMHVAIARLSQHLHSGGVYLVAFSARSAVVCGGDDSKGGQQTVWKSKVRDCLALKQKLCIWRHTMRLVTGNRYCFTYGLIGAPVTMRTFTKVCGNRGFGLKNKSF